MVLVCLHIARMCSETHGKWDDEKRGGNESTAHHENASGIDVTGFEFFKKVGNDVY